MRLIVLLWATVLHGYLYISARFVFNVLQFEACVVLRHLPVKNEEGLAHILIILPLQKLLTEPNIEAAVILGLQITAFRTN